MGEGSYLNFDLIIERAGEKYRARVFDSPAGQASTEFKIPFSELELENFVLRMGRPRAGVRRVDSSEMEAVKQCGERLFQAVFTDDVYASFLRSRDTALEAGKGLRVRLRIDVPEFHDYPWEFLYNAHMNQFLALSKDTPVVRYLELPYPVQPLTVQPPLKILVMISSPDGFPKLNVEEEWKLLSDALVPLIRRGLVTLERLKKPTLSALQQHLRRGEYHIFHFIGHGKFSEYKQDGMLLLEEDGGQGRPVSGQFLGTVLHDHRSLRLVVLNACEGARTSRDDPYAGVAQTLVLQGIPAVIAMQLEILETAAITFAQEFYGAVADGFPVDAAVAEARKAIFAAGNEVEWGVPVLYMRTPQGVIFEIPEAQRVVPSIEEPIAYVDKEIEQKLERLYTEGLAAFWVEDWDKACDRFQRILADRPDHTAATDKLAEAKRQRNLATLYARAAEAQKAENWTAALKTLEELLKDAPEYKDAAAMFKAVKKQKQLAELYAEAKQLHEAKKWQAVAKVFAQIKSVDTNYPDPENLLSMAEQELEELKRQAELNELYSRAVRAMDAGQWGDAQRLLGQVQEKQPGFQETERLLSRVEAKVRQSEADQKQQDQINTLYEQAHGLLRAKKWRQALDKIGEIRKLDEQFEDLEKIGERAQKELAREEQEAERQNELAAMYAEAVRLLREEKYQEALDKWQDVRAIDAKYPDRQWVQRTARRKLQGISQSKIQPDITKFNLTFFTELDSGWLLIVAFIGTMFIRAMLGAIMGWLHIWDPGSPLLPQVLSLIVIGGIYGAIVAFSLGRIIHNWGMWQSLIVIIGWAIGLGLAMPTGRWGWDFIISTMFFGGFSVAGAIKWAEPKVHWFKVVTIFICWALTWKIGNPVGGYLRDIFDTDYTWCIADAITILFGLLATFGIYEHTSSRLIKLTGLSILGFTAGNYVATGLWEILSRNPVLAVTISLAVWGFVGGVVFDLPSRDWKRILSRGGLCGLGFLLGYIAEMLILPAYMQEAFPGRYGILKNIIWGTGLGLCFSLPSRKLSVIGLLIVIGSSMFVFTSGYNAILSLGEPWMSILRGALIGLVLGFGYAYATMETRNSDSHKNSAGT